MRIQMRCVAMLSSLASLVSCVKIWRVSCQFTAVDKSFRFAGSEMHR